MACSEENSVIWIEGQRGICELLHHFARHTYSASGNNSEQPRNYMQDVIDILGRDYLVTKIDNKNGVLCPQYPEIIPIVESVRYSSIIYEDEYDPRNISINQEEITNLFEGAKLSRCRQRFPVPVILFNGKYICRSSTLSSNPEICYRSGLINVPGYELLQSVKELWWPTEGLDENPDIDEEEPKEPHPCDNDVRTKTICDKVRSLDISLLKKLNVSQIVDIMVEKRKVKHSLHVSSSEKVEKKRYADFKLMSLPFPGCEFFKKYSDNFYNANGLKFDWENRVNDAVLTIPNDEFKEIPDIKWDDYKEWELIHLTQNYMKYILKRIQDDDSSLLLHCISGWDRTPLFISLIRLSLWADELIHISCDEVEILYLTLAYDWYLFGHHLANRIYKHEEVMAFCFDFLRHITGDEYSVNLKPRLDDPPARTESFSFRPDMPLMFTCDPPTPPRYHYSRKEAANTAAAAKKASRSASCGSNSSSSGSDWHVISETGSDEADFTAKSKRFMKLETVRTLFISSYRKEIKWDTFGPPKKWMYEDIIGTMPNLKYWSSYFDFPAALNTLIFGENNDNAEEENIQENGNNVSSDNKAGNRLRDEENSNF